MHLQNIKIIYKFENALLGHERETTYPRQQLLVPLFHVFYGHERRRQCRAEAQMPRPTSERKLPERNSGEGQTQLGSQPTIRHPKIHIISSIAYYLAD